MAPQVVAQQPAFLTNRINFKTGDNLYKEKISSVLSLIDQHRVIKTDSRLLVLSGVISTNVIVPENSAVYVPASVRMQTNCTLTVGGGVVFMFEKGCSLEVNGDVYINGSPTNGVYFSSKQKGDSLSEWDGIKIRNGNARISYSTFEGAADAVYIYKSTSQLASVNFINCTKAVDVRETMVGITLSRYGFGGEEKPWSQLVKKGEPNRLTDCNFINCNFAFTTEYEIQQGDIQGGISDFLFEKCFIYQCQSGISVPINQRPVHNIVVSNSDFFKNKSACSLGNWGGSYGLLMGDIKITKNRFIENQLSLGLLSFNSINGNLRVEDNVIANSETAISFDGYKQGGALTNIVVRQNAIIKCNKISSSWTSLVVFEDNLLNEFGGIIFHQSSFYDDETVWHIRGNIFDNCYNPVFSTVRHGQVLFTDNLISNHRSLVALENKWTKPITAINNSVINAHGLDTSLGFLMDYKKDLNYGIINYTSKRPESFDRSWWASKVSCILF